jgi:hypothetical protein
MDESKVDQNLSDAEDLSEEKRLLLLLQASQSQAQERRLRAQVKRERFQNQSQRAQYYLGHDRNTGRALVGNGAGMELVKILGNVQPTPGQQGKAGARGFKAGVANRPETPRRRTKQDVFGYAFVTYDEGTYTAYYVGDGTGVKTVHSIVGPSNLSVSIWLIYDNKSNWDITISYYNPSTQMSDLVWVRSQFKYQAQGYGLVSPLGRGEFNQCSNHIEAEARVVRHQRTSTLNVTYTFWRVHPRRANLSYPQEIPLPPDVNLSEPEYNNDPAQYGELTILEDYVPPYIPNNFAAGRSGFLTRFRSRQALAFYGFTDGGALQSRPGFLQFEGRTETAEYSNKSGATTLADPYTSLGGITFENMSADIPLDAEHSSPGTFIKPADTAQPGVMPNNIGEFRGAFYKVSNLGFSPGNFVLISPGGIAYDPSIVGQANVDYYFKQSTKVVINGMESLLDGEGVGEGYDIVRGRAVNYYSEGKIYHYNKVPGENDDFAEKKVTLPTLDTITRTVTLKGYRQLFDKMTARPGFRAASNLAVNAGRVRA